MAINLPQTQKLTAADMGAFDLGAAISSGLNNAAKFQEARFKPQSMQEQLLGQQLQNKIQGVNAKYAERNAQAGLDMQNANLGLLPYKQALLEAQARSAGSAADKSNFMQKMIGQILGNQAPGQAQIVNQPQETPNQEPQESIGAQQNLQQSPAMQPQQQAAQEPQQKTKDISYPQAALMTKMLGMGEPKIIDVDGRKLAVTPFGNIPIATGQTEFQKKLSGEDAKRLSSIEESYANAQQSKDTLEELGNLMSTPDFEQMRLHPIAGKYEMIAYSKFGTPKQQELAAKYMTYTGQIIKDAARDFKGQFRVGEQALLNSMKPSLGDTATAAKAKTQALYKLVDTLTKRSELTSNNMRNLGMSPVDAIKDANKKIRHQETKSEKIVTLIKNGIKHDIPAGNVEDAIKKWGYTHG